MRKICTLAAVAACAFVPTLTSAVTLTPIYTHLGTADLSMSNDPQYQDTVKTTIYGLRADSELFSLGYTKTTYKFSNSMDKVEFHKLFGDVRYTQVNPGSLGYFVGAGLAFGWEDEFNISENYSFTPRAGLNYNFGEWTISGGMHVNFNEIENFFQPILTAQYRSFDDLGFSGVFGTYNRAQYRFSNALAVEGSVKGIDREIYQLADDTNKYGPIHGGYIMERCISASAGIVVNPIEALTLKAGVEARFDRDLKIYNKDGNKIRTLEADPSYGFYINGSLKF